MANDKRKKTKQKREIIIYAILVLALIIFCIWYYYKYYYVVESINTPIILEVEESSTSNTAITDLDGTLYVHMIDCGQGDSFLFEYEGQYGLIDCGTKSESKKVIQYLKKEGVKELQFIMGSHQHDDHIGGLNNVLNSFDYDVIYLPEIKDDLVTSDWYEAIIDKIDEDGVEVINPKINDEFKLGEVNFKVVGQLTPEEAKNDLNNYSTVVKVTFGQMDLLMTGDAEEKVETYMLNSDTLSECEILKLGHHGSNTSSSRKFIEKVNPEYGLISCSVGNRYKHPNKETVDILKEKNVEIYRTDECGDVVVSITCDSITFDKLPGDYLDGETLAK